jgi:hypothetical protein
VLKRCLHWLLESKGPVTVCCTLLIRFVQLNQAADCEHDSFGTLAVTECGILMYHFPAICQRLALRCKFRAFQPLSVVHPETMHTGAVLCCAAMPYCRCTLRCQQERTACLHISEAQEYCHRSVTNVQPAVLCCILMHTACPTHHAQAQQPACELTTTNICTWGSKRAPAACIEGTPAAPCQHGSCAPTDKGE